MTSVQVLLATYNGRRYLPELLESVLAQEDVAVEVLARDDCSSDGTWELLQDVAATHRVVACQGPRLGPARSFFALLERSSAHADYLALADQDDVWHPVKLRRAVDLLTSVGADRAAMYCSRLTLAAEDLTPLGLSEAMPKGPSFENSLLQNIATGCTIVLNRAARSVLLRELPSTTFMHDWWFYQVVAGLGSVVYDDRSFILYRQHGANAVGGAATLARRLRVRAERLLRRRLRLFGPEQLQELLRIHGPALPPRRRALLERHLEGRRRLRARLRLALGRDVVLQRSWEQALVRCLILGNRL